jgi:hypothetical protein
MGDDDDCECWLSPEDAITDLMDTYGMTIEEACEWLAQFVADNPLHVLMHDETMH